VNDLAMDMNRLLHAYECEEDAEGIKEIILCGGAAKIEGLDRELAGALGRRVRAVSPELHGIGGVDGVAGPDLTVAIGLALRSVDKPEINLIPDRILVHRETVERRRVNRNIAIYAGMILFLLGGIVGVNFQAKLAHRARLQTALDNIEPKIKDIRRKKAEIDAIRASIDQENSFYNVLQELYRITPDNVMYLTINFEKRKQLDLRGRVPTDQDFLTLMNVLKESEYFKDVQPGPYKWVNMYNKVAVREFDTSSCILRSNTEYRTRRAPRTTGRK
jgi:cell division ATPase FtsA